MESYTDSSNEKKQIIKAQELGEEERIQYSVISKYVGSFLVPPQKEEQKKEVAEKDLEESVEEEVQRFSSTEFVKRQLELLSSVSKSRPVLLVVSLGGIKMCSPDGKEAYMAHALRRVNYTTCDTDFNQFAFVAREPSRLGTTGLHYCHVFKTHSTQQVEEINSLVGNAFRAAFLAKLRTDPTDSEHTKSLSPSSPPGKSSPHPHNTSTSSEGRKETLEEEEPCDGLDPLTSSYSTESSHQSSSDRIYSTLDPPPTALYSESSIPSSDRNRQSEHSSQRGEEIFALRHRDRRVDTPGSSSGISVDTSQGSLSPKGNISVEEDREKMLTASYPHPMPSPGQLHSRAREHYPHRMQGTSSCRNSPGNLRKGANSNICSVDKQNYEIPRSQSPKMMAADNLSRPLTPKNRRSFAHIGHSRSDAERKAKSVAEIYPGPKLSKHPQESYEKGRELYGSTFSSITTYKSVSDAISFPASGRNSDKNNSSVSSHTNRDLSAPKLPSLGPPSGPPSSAYAVSNCGIPTPSTSTCPKGSNSPPSNQNASSDSLKLLPKSTREINGNTKLGSKLAENSNGQENSDEVTNSGFFKRLFSGRKQKNRDRNKRLSMGANFDYLENAQGSFTYCKPPANDGSAPIAVSRCEKSQSVALRSGKDPNNRRRRRPVSEIFSSAFHRSKSHGRTFKEMAETASSCKSLNLIGANSVQSKKQNIGNMDKNMRRSVNLEQILRVKQNGEGRQESKCRLAGSVREHTLERRLRESPPQMGTGCGERCQFQKGLSPEFQHLQQHEYLLPITDEDEFQIKDVPWYCGELSRDVVCAELKQCGEGAFLVRRSVTQRSCLALSVRVPSTHNPYGISHYLILRTTFGYKLKGFSKQFSSVQSLVTHHSVMREQLPCRLRFVGWDADMWEKERNLERRRRFAGRQKDLVEEEEPIYGTLPD